MYAGFKRFEVSINGVVHQIRDVDAVNFDGEQLTGEQLYEKLQGCKPRDVLASWGRLHSLKDGLITAWKSEAQRKRKLTALKNLEAINVGD